MEQLSDTSLNVETIGSATLLLAFVLFLTIAAYRISPHLFRALTLTKAQDLKALQRAVAEVVAAWERQAKAQRESCARELQAQREMFKELFIHKDKP